LAAIIRAHQNNHIFDRHDDRQSPDDHRKHPKNPLLAHADAVREALLNGVKRGGADVAVDHAERRDGQALSDARVSFSVSSGCLWH
jgi:hypothetical protein